MVVNRVWAMPHKNTFSIKPIGELVERYTSGEKVIIDPVSTHDVKMCRGDVFGDKRKPYISPGLEKAKVVN